MSTPTQIENHSEVAYDLLTTPLKEKPVIKAILRTWTDKLQEVEDDVYKLMARTLFLNAEGANLDRYGSLFNVNRPEGITDYEFRVVLVGEILRRASDGTPDKIRQILESTLSLKGMSIFEHYNENQLPYTMGAVMVYSYPSDLNTPFPFSLKKIEADFLKKACPVTSGSVVFGVHNDRESNLFVPAELADISLKMGLNTSGQIITDESQLDILVNETDDFIVVSSDNDQVFAEGFQRGVLPEIGRFEDNFAIDDQNQDIEDFLVDTQGQGVDNMTVQIVSASEPNTDHGICLEISQLTYEEFINATY